MNNKRQTKQNNYQTASNRVGPTLSESVVLPDPNDAREPRSKFSTLSSSDVESSKSL